MGYDNQPGDFTLPTKFTAKRAAEVARRKKIPTPSATAPQEEKQTAIKKKQEIQHAEEINTEIKSKEPKIETKKNSYSLRLIEKDKIKKYFMTFGTSNGKYKIGF